MMRNAIVAAFAATAAASPVGKSSAYGSNDLSSIVSSVETLLQGDLARTGSLAPVTSQILEGYIEPIQVSLVDYGDLQAAGKLITSLRHNYSAIAMFSAKAPNCNLVASIGRPPARMSTGLGWTRMSLRLRASHSTRPSTLRIQQKAARRKS